MCGGLGSNSMGELLSLWLLLHLSSSIGVDEIRVFGDSKVIIDWEKNAYEINILHLPAWLKRTHSLIPIYVLYPSIIYTGHTTNLLINFQKLVMWHMLASSSMSDG